MAILDDNGGHDTYSRDDGGRHADGHHSVGNNSGGRDAGGRDDYNSNHDTTDDYNADGHDNADDDYNSSMETVVPGPFSPSRFFAGQKIHCRPNHDSLSVCPSRKKHVNVSCFFQSQE
jgi:hypothetical protein